MAFENMPAVLQQIFQQNMLDRRFQEQISTVNAYRQSAYRLEMETRSGEVMIYSRAGRISPSLEDIVPSTNNGIDNGLTGSVEGIGTSANTYPFEQFQISIGMLPSVPIDLNLIQAEEVIADLFKQNVDNLAENAALSLDLRAARYGFRAYEGGRTFVTAAVTGTSNIHVDNVFGFDLAFQTATINGATFPYGLPQTTSSTVPQAATVYPASGAAAFNITITAVTYDGTGPANWGGGSSGGNTGNLSTMAANGLNLGWSGTLTISGSADPFSVGDAIYASDSQPTFRPNNKTTRLALDATDTIGAQLIINGVAELRRNRIKPPLSNGTYPCYIDPIVDAQFFTDPQYQIMSQGQMESPDFKGARVSQNFGVTFVPTTNSPAYSFVNHASVSLVARRALICGEKWLQYSPFKGTKEAISKMPDMNVADYRVVDDIVFVTRSPLDRAGQILSQMWWWIGGFVAPTNATITPVVVPSATASRYKSAVSIEVASAS